MTISTIRAFSSLRVTVLMFEQVAAAVEWDGEACRWDMVDRGQTTVRREVQMYCPPATPADYDPSAIPIEWRSWLNGNRRVAPSAEEIQR